MPLISSRRHAARQSRTFGLAQDFEKIVDDVVGTVVDHATFLKKTVGPAWGSEVTSGGKPVLERMDEYEDLRHIDHARKLSSGQIARMAIEAVQKRTKAEEAGEWTRTARATGIEAPAAPAPQAPAAPVVAPALPAVAPAAPVAGTGIDFDKIAAAVNGAAVPDGVTAAHNAGLF